MTETTELIERLLARTLELVDIPSTSGDEDEVLSFVDRSMSGWPPADRQDAVRLFLPERRPGAPSVLIAGHVDTVPPSTGLDGRREGGAVVGRGAADMKGAVAVMLEVVADPPDSDVDVGFLFFGREELPTPESALVPLLARRPELAEFDLAIVMEPTDGAIEVGCNGNLNATVRVRGRAAHSARPWLGDNAIHTVIEALASVVDLPVRDVEIDGLIYREVVSVTHISGGGAARNVVPDLAEAHVNFRYAPNHTPADAEDRLRELLGHRGVDVEIVGNAPPGPVAIGNPLVERLRRAGNLSVGPKQGWTPVAEFAGAGIDAVNFGPGDPRLAHRDDERVDGEALVRSFQVLRAFLGSAPGGR